MSNMKNISKQLETQVSNMEESFAIGLNRIKEVEKYVTARISQVRRIINRTPAERWNGTLLDVIDTLVQVQRLIDKIEEVDIEKEEVWSDEEISSQDVSCY